MDFFEFGWRDGVLLIAALVAVYLVLTLLKLAQLRRHRGASHEASYSPASFREFSMEPPVLPEPDFPVAPIPFGDQLAAKRYGAPELVPAGADSGFDDEMTRLRGEVEMLRREVAEFRTARRVSPQYSDAMALAQRGYDAQGIAVECGISVGEAELVLALSRNTAGFDDEVDDGGDTRNTAGARGR